MSKNNNSAKKYKVTDTDITVNPKWFFKQEKVKKQIRDLKNSKLSEFRAKKKQLQES